MSSSNSCKCSELNGLTFADIDERLPKEEYFLDIFTLYGFIPDRETLDGSPCPECGYKTTLLNNPKAKLCYMVQCRKKKCKLEDLNPCQNCKRFQGSCLTICKYSVSPLSGTMFHNTKLNFGDIFKIFFLFVTGASNTEISEKAGVSLESCGEWLNLCREACGERINRPCQQIGGNGMTVEIGENELNRRKDHQQNVQETDCIWVLGGICRETDQCFIEFCAKRNAKSIGDVIYRRVAEGSAVITDSLDDYEGLIETLDERPGHFILNYSPTIAETQISSTTDDSQVDKIEELWPELKREVKSVQETVNQTGVQRVNTYLYKFMYFRNVLGQIPKTRTDLRFHRFLEDLRDAYPAIQKQVVRQHAKRKARKQL